MLKRLQINGSYLIIAPNLNPNESGYVHSLAEHALLVDSILSFLKRHPELDENQVTIYELKEINERDYK